MSEVGALIVSLQAETAKFREDMGKVKGDLDDLKDKSGGAAQALEGIGEARGGIMLIEDAVGVRLPRHLNSLIAQIPGVGAAFALMLPIAGVAVAIKIVGELIEKHEALGKAIRAAAQEATNQAVKQADEGKSLELTNLKLDDQIAKLEHKPAQNYMKEAILETSQEIDKLAATFATDFQKMNGVLDEHLGFWHRVGRGIEDAFSGVGQGKGYGTGTEELNKLRAAMTEVEAKRRALAEAPMTNEAQAAAQGALITALHGQISELDVVKTKFSDSKEMLLQFSTAAASSANEIKDLNLAIAAGGKKEVIAKLTQGAENLEPLKQAAALTKILADQTDKYDQSLIKLAQTKAETAIAESKGGGNSDITGQLDQQKAAIEEERAYSIAATNAELAAKRAAYAADVAAAGSDTAKKRELTLEWIGEMREAAEASAQLNAASDAKIVAADNAAAAKRREIAAELNKAIVSMAESATKQQETANLEGYKVDEAANNAQHSLGLETERQYIQSKIALSEMEFAEKRKSLNAQIELENAAADMANESGDSKGESEAIEKANQLRSQRNSLDAQFRAELIQQQAEAAKLNSSWSSYFQKMQEETMDLSTKIRTNLQHSVTEFEDQFANSMAKCIVEGKNLGMAVRKEAEQMLEAMVSMLVKWLEQWIISHAMATITGKTSAAAQQQSSASLAGANMVASWAAAPWPLDAMAPAMGAEAFAAAMAYSAETGGKLPGEGPVPLLAHGGETVVTKALTDRVESAERNGGSGGGDMHMHYSPQVHAMDAAGVDRVLTKHGADFERAARNVARRRNK